MLGGGMQAGMGVILVKEICRVCPGFVGAFGVSLGLGASTILARGTLAQKQRWVPPLVTLEKIAAWALTEPGSGSDAFGAMQTTARRDGDGYLLNGQKTFITNGPYADTIVVYAKLDDGTTPARDRQILTFVLDAGMPGLTQGKPFRKMGFHSSPTGELFFDNVRLDADRLLADGDGRESAKSGFVAERTGVAAMSLGIIEECLDQCTRYAKERVQFGHPIADYQLVQLKLANMEIARVNVQNMVFRALEMAADGKQPTLAEASAMKLYSSQAATEVAMEAVQLFGGNGYMSEYPLEQLARDAKSLMIYAGSNEIQATHIAKGVLER
jgi:alkylation response protein AidB-like acyl-CoA dehydrogenase